MRVDVSFLPPAGAPGERTCLVVDVLRATSCMAVLFGRGFEAIYPAASIEAARALRSRLGDSVLLCGEVGALPPEGFDFGNSPSEFASADLRATRAVVATTNGTPALLACAEAPLVLAAAPLNARACLDAALGAGRDVLVVAAGRRGAYAEDDTLAAGLLAARLAEAGAAPGEEAARAVALYEDARDDLAAAFGRSEHGRILAGLGFAADLEFCAQRDRYDVAAALRREGDDFVLRPV